MYHICVRTIAIEDQNRGRTHGYISRKDDAARPRSKSAVQIADAA